jgi:hypothetical protein
MLETFLDAETEVEKSPKIVGATQGAKAAIIAAPLGMAIQALRGRSPIVGGVVSGLAVGGAAGLLAAAMQKYKNMQTESALKYHMQNLIERNPEMMQNSQLPQTFSRGFENVRNTYQTPY